MDTPLHRLDDQQRLQALMDMTADELSYVSLDEWRKGCANVAFMDAQALKQRQADAAVLPDDISPQERARRVERTRGVLP